MKKVFTLLCLILPGIIVLQSCKKEEEVKTFPYKAIPQEVRDYAWFDVGSYWVYEDSATKQLDSIYIYNTQTRKGRNYNQNTPLTDFELLTVFARSAQTNSKYDFHMGTYDDLMTNSIVILYSSPLLQDSLRRSEMLYHPLELNRSFNRPTGAFILKDTLTSYTLNGKVYKSVKLFYTESDGIMDYHQSLTWIAPNYGIIKKECLDVPKTYWLKTSKLFKK